MTVELGRDNAPENFAVMRRLAVNLLGREKSKGGVKNQFLAAMDNEYLTKVLAAIGYRICLQLRR